MLTKKFEQYQATMYGAQLRGHHPLTYLCCSPSQTLLLESDLSTAKYKRREILLVELEMRLAQTREISQLLLVRILNKLNDKTVKNHSKSETAHRIA